MGVFDRPVMVTGAAGCIGSWVIAELLRRGVEPIAVDVVDERRRLALLVDKPQSASLDWLLADVSDCDSLIRIARDRSVGSIIHLAALQIPFCKADPVTGAQVNVTGTVAILETARRCEIEHLAIASSVAAFEQHTKPTTLYGVYKLATENLAKIYWQDWQVPSVCIRPHTVYGPGRDQGLTSEPTKAMLATAARQAFTIKFRGPLQMQYAGEVAAAFIAAAERCPKGVLTGFLQGAPTTVEEVVSMIEASSPHARISIEGDPLPFPADFDEIALHESVGPWEKTPLETGIRDTLARFEDLLSRGLLSSG